MTNTTTADILAIKAVIAVLISELDDDVTRQLRDAATDVVRNYSRHSEETKREATERIANLLDLAA
jgi:uncharacterized protein (UPF0147 family)